MSVRLLVVGALTAAVGSAGSAAVYAHFSARVMPALAALPAVRGLTEMQRRNITVVRSPFIVCFLGAAVLSGIFLVQLTRGRSAAELLAGVGGIAYLVGFVMTIGYHVPRNNTLAVLDPADPRSVAVWERYLQEWTPANTVRAVLSAIAVALFVSSAVVGSRQG